MGRVTGTGEAPVPGGRCDLHPPHPPPAADTPPGAEEPGGAHRFGDPAEEPGDDVPPVLGDDTGQEHGRQRGSERDGHVPLPAGALCPFALSAVPSQTATAAISPV